MVRHLLGPAQRALGLWFSRRYIRGERYACYNQTIDEERRSSAAERRTGFDWLLFQMMLSDQVRIDAYRRDIAAMVPGTRVLEIGPGPAAVLSRLCLYAGAAFVMSVEGEPWVAEHAKRRLLRERRYAGQWRVIPKLSTNLTIDDLDGDPHFDVLVLEAYDTIASQEHVVETIADMRRRGFSFDTVISRGFETLVGPTSAPPAEPLTRAERVLLGWGAGSVDRVQRQFRQRRSTLHGDMGLIEGLRLASPKVWQTADFETTEPAHTEAVLNFGLSDPGSYGGFLFHNRFLFRKGVLDTSATSTHWGLYFAPLSLPQAAINDAGHVTLRTTVTDPTQPSSFSLQAEAAGIESVMQSF